MGYVLMCVRTYVSLHVTDDAALVYELTHVVLSGETTVNLAKHQPTPPGQTAAIAGQTDSCCAAFIGCRLDKDHLKDWLRQCTVQVCCMVSVTRTIVMTTTVTIFPQFENTPTLKKLPPLFIDEKSKMVRFQMKTLWYIWQLLRAFVCYRYKVVPYCYAWNMQTGLVCRV